MVSRELITRLKGSSIEEIQSAASLRLLLGVVNKKKGRKVIDFTCPSCIWEALTIFRKLSVDDFLTLITKEMPSNRLFILKGEGAKARTFTYQRVKYSNDNLTDEIALRWLSRSAKGVSNFIFMPEAYRKAKEAISTDNRAPLEAWKAEEEVKSSTPTLPDPEPENEETPEELAEEVSKIKSKAKKQTIKKVNS